MTRKLFAILIGGAHPSANIEIHDMRFCIGSSLEDTYAQLKTDWWGTPSSLHIDAYAELDVVDGYRVEIVKPGESEPSDNRLWFINCGYYEEGIFGEGHAYRFMVGSEKPAVWKRVLNDVRQDFISRHKDNFVDVDDILDVTDTLFEQGAAVRLTYDPSLIDHRPRMVSEYIPFS